MDPANNPYTPGAGVRPPYLASRDGDLEAFRIAIQRLHNGDHARSFVLSGLRGVGKTVLLTEFDTITQSEGWVSSGVIECNEDDDVGRVLALLAHRALRRLSRRRRATDAVKRALGVLKAFQWSVDQGGAWRLNIDVEAVSGVADSGHREDDIVELLVEVGAAALEQGSGVVLLLDEMQFLGADDLRLLATVFHGLQQRTAPILLAAAGLPQLPLMLVNARPYTERLFHYRDVGGVGDAAARAALAVPAQRRGAEYTPQALDFVVSESGGYPYFIQQWGETVWNEAEGPNITLDDARAALEVVNDELDRRFFRDRYDKATEMERIYMAAMADLGDGPHPSGGIAAHMDRTAKSVSVVRDGLLKKGLIFNPLDTTLDFTVPQFARYMRAVHPFDPNQRPTRGRRPRAG